MARFEFEMPDVGEGLADVEVVRWFVKIGDTVEENQSVADVETDKAIVTMPAPASGRIIELAVQEGERVKVGAFLLAIETSDEPAGTAAQKVEATPGSAVSLADNGQQPTEKAAVAKAKRVLASPIARKRARELGIALEDVAGSGSSGRIRVEDIERYAASLQQTDEAAVKIAAPDRPADRTGRTGDVERIPVRGLRRRIAESLTETARTIPHVVGFHEFDAQALVGERTYLKPHAEAAGVTLTYLPFIVKATTEALKKHPYLNSSYVDGDDPAILLYKSYNIGIATATNEGLIVPVVHRADQLSLFEIAAKSEQLIVAARERRIAPQEVQDGTFTINNIGPDGGWFGTSIIRAPEAAILSIGKIAERAVVRNGQVVARPILPIALTFDHRVIDGDEALAFIKTLRHHLEEDPRSLSPW
jgi:pyruvate dehydrogenase E2 component (dihydrolipoamide acetyltransferase)